MAFTFTRRAAVAVLAAALAATASCTVKNSETPALSGPSGLALTLRVSAIPDSISQDGGSQSSVKVTAIGPDGKGVANQPIRVDMMVNGVAVDYGSLSARTIVTGADGVASVIYTAPPAPPNGVYTPCASTLLAASLPGSCVTIIASSTATNFQTAAPESAVIRLVPLGVILPPATAPTPSFQFAPSAPVLNQAITFDATASVGPGQIASYSWNFGDGSSGTGAVVTHSYSTAASYVVTLTVTNDRGVSASTTKSVTVVPSTPPSAPSINQSPSTVHPGDTVFFNATGSTATSGRTITSYDWDFGDGTPHGSGTSTTHVYGAVNTYKVTLIVTDDQGQKSSSTTTVQVT
jgi:PKD repeat protein